MKLQKKLLGTAVAAMLALSACSSQPTTANRRIRARKHGRVTNRS